MISIQQTRELLGREAEGKTDAELLAIRDQVDAFAACIIEGFLEQQQQKTKNAEDHDEQIRKGGA